MTDDTKTPSGRPFPKRRAPQADGRDSREVRNAVSGMEAAISAQVLMLANLRARAASSQPSEQTAAIADGVEGIKAATERLRAQLADVRGTLPERLRGHSRLRDLDRALSALEAGADSLVRPIRG